MRFSDVIKRPVIDLATAADIGRVDDAVVDPVARRVIGFRLKKTPDDARWLAWDQITALGPDALTAATAAAVTVREDAPGRLLRADGVIGGRVLTDQGMELGALADFELDPATGLVVGLLLADGTMIEASALLGIGRHATVIRHQG
jgi:uncharacterized protein YrrD